MVEGARLESVYTGNRIEGSNPSVSANTKQHPLGFAEGMLFWSVWSRPLVGKQMRRNKK